MLQPKRTKFRKAFKGRIHGNAKGGTELNFGAFGLKAMEPERITARQIEAARRAITRHIRRQGRLWIRIFPDVPVSSKPAEVRMGSGKGSPEFWVARVMPDRILFELDGVPGHLAKTAFERAAAAGDRRSAGREELRALAAETRETVTLEVLAGTDTLILDEVMGGEGGVWLGDLIENVPAADQHHLAAPDDEALSVQIARCLAGEEDDELRGPGRVEDVEADQGEPLPVLARAGAAAEAVAGGEGNLERLAAQLL